MWSTGIGNHQKINKVALRKLGELTALNHFPNNRLLRHFEGNRGPDGIKLKSPGKNEPCSFYDPFDPSHTGLLDEINHHYEKLVQSLRQGNSERAGFEASWLAHSLVDGLTPAHHYPYEEEIGKLRNIDTSRTIAEMVSKPSDKIHIKGRTPVQTIKNNWKVWGVKGLLLTHTTFEAGVAFMSAPLRFSNVHIDTSHIKNVQKIGIDAYFAQSARRIALLRLYDQFYNSGWTYSLARKVRIELMPEMIEVVATIWYCALSEAGLTTRQSHASY